MNVILKIYMFSHLITHISELYHLKNSESFHNYFVSQANHKKMKHVSNADSIQSYRISNFPMEQCRHL